MKYPHLHGVPKVPFLIIDSASRMFGPKEKELIFDQVKADLLEEYIENVERYGGLLANVYIWFFTIKYVAHISVYLFLRPIIQMVSKIVS